MARVVLDTAVLVSALLKPIPGGACYDLVQLAEDEAFELFLSPDILEETVRVLLTRGRIRRRYAYSDDDVEAFCWRLTDIATIIRAAPAIQVVRDPDDDMILACAIAASADYLITRDKDLLILDNHEGIAILTPEAFLQVLRIGD
jgi:uncharacterized protein